MTASYSARSESRVGRFFLRLFLAVLGLAVGLFAYVFAWQQDPLFKCQHC